jgi:hypothetical protein
LREQERAVLSLYYFEELKLHEIGAVLNLTESRVCQIRKRALGKLREDLSVRRQHAAGRDSAARAGERVHAAGAAAAECSPPQRAPYEGQAP